MIRSLVSRKPTEAAPIKKPIEELISEISRFGRPSIFQLSNGRWCAWVNVNNSSAQTTVEVKCNDATFKGALEGLLSNVESTVEDLGGRNE